MNPGVSPWPLDTKVLFPELAPSSDTPGAGEQRSAKGTRTHCIGRLGHLTGAGFPRAPKSSYTWTKRKRSVDALMDTPAHSLSSVTPRCHMPPCATCPAVGTGPMCGADASPAGAPRQRPQSCPHTRREGRGERAGAAPWRPRRPSNHLPPGRGFKMADGERPGEAV